MRNIPNVGGGNIAVIIVICVVVGIILFFITRELWCWYYKINRRCNLLEEQNGLLRQLINEQVQSNIMMSQLLAKENGTPVPGANQMAPGAPMQGRPMGSDPQGMGGQPDMMGQPMNDWTMGNYPQDIDQ